MDDQDTDNLSSKTQSELAALYGFGQNNRQDGHFGRVSGSLEFWRDPDTGRMGLRIARTDGTEALVVFIDEAAEVSLHAFTALTATKKPASTALPDAEPLHVKVNLSAYAMWSRDKFIEDKVDVIELDAAHTAPADYMTDHAKRMDMRRALDHVDILDHYTPEQLDYTARVAQWRIDEGLNNPSGAKNFIPRETPKLRPGLYRVDRHGEIELVDQPRPLESSYGNVLEESKSPYDGRYWPKPDIAG